jgi:hypothetical protein
MILIIWSRGNLNIFFSLKFWLHSSNHSIIYFSVWISFWTVIYHQIISMFPYSDGRCAIFTSYIMNNTCILCPQFFDWYSIREKVSNSIFIFRAISLTSVGKPPCFLHFSRGGGNEIHAPCACGYTQLTLKRTFRVFFFINCVCITCAWLGGLGVISFVCLFFCFAFCCCCCLFIYLFSI